MTIQCFFKNIDNNDFENFFLQTVIACVMWVKILLADVKKSGRRYLKQLEKNQNALQAAYLA